jgi:glycosyltransferase involved in cell wall biosynthesis
MLHRPTITLIVACYNVAPFLEECLQSIVNQTYPCFQVLAINDGSSDDTSKIIDEFAQKDARIIAIHQSNKGLSATRNIGIQRTDTPWVSFVDGDDFLAPDYLQKLMDHHELHDLVACSYHRVFQSTILPRVFKCNGSRDASWLQRRIIGLYGNELRDPSQADSMVTAWGKLYRTSLIQQHQVAFVSTQLIGTEDALFNIQYLENASQVYILDQPLYHYRKYNAQSLTNTYKPRLQGQWMHLYELIEPYTESKSPEFKIAFHNRIALSLIGLGLNEMLNPAGFWAQYSTLKALLQEPRYQQAYAQLETRYFPVHWRLFFGMAKYRIPLGVLLMLKGIQWMIKKNQ